ncbi:hypothetical protein C7974DRAFT_312261 [Boeremia exigua]|uniref:uncharacterized protein n=1 Tax=Boeremia exigua TaxID=749465 RepID=UPI001E8D0288|nr:uncharacterized protein C7974DRAFT_312261 [Boeremia exigua]KAH6625857.1 hypothetical protein C7974DRAFT_312261 [Boeremia exigua]
MTSIDVLHEIVPGYPKLAARIELQPELAIYRRFVALNAQNLLYFQAELTDLERTLREQQVIDHRDGTGNKSRYAVHWYWLKESERDRDTDQLELVMRVREVLKEYSAQAGVISANSPDHALMQQSAILNYPNPDRWDLHHMQDYLQSAEMGKMALRGFDADIWGTALQRDDHKCDLVTLRPRAREDPFSKWVNENAIVRFFRCGCARRMKPSPVHGMIGYEDTTVFRITYWFTSILASLLLVASIAILYSVESVPARLGIIAAFNVVVSICLMGLANAKRAEVFAITAA